MGPLCQCVQNALVRLRHRMAIADDRWSMLQTCRSARCSSESWHASNKPPSTPRLIRTSSRSMACGSCSRPMLPLLGSVSRLAGCTRSSSSCGSRSFLRTMAAHLGCSRSTSDDSHSLVEAGRNSSCSSSRISLDRTTTRRSRDSARSSMWNARMFWSRAGRSRTSTRSRLECVARVIARVISIDSHERLTRRFWGRWFGIEQQEKQPRFNESDLYDGELVASLQQLYAPYNRKLEHLLRRHGHEFSAWEY